MSRGPRRIQLILVFTFGIGCAETPSAPPTKRETAKSGRPEMPKPTWPEGAIAPHQKPLPCVARLEIETRREGGRIHLTGTLTSNQEGPVEIELLTRCPGGPISFTGLGDHFDYYGRCRQGACREPTTRVSLTVPAGGAGLRVVELSWPEDGDGCRTPLAPGHYDINAWGELQRPEDSALCGMAHATLDLPAPPKPTSKEKPSHECKPMPTCGIFCESGRYAHDEHGCPLCGCED